jgi:NhaA family Na+:H+ antiporter
MALVLFLTAVAIVDDIGAILVIAIVYTDTVSLLSLVVGCAGLALALLASRSGVRNPLAYLLFGTIVWIAFMKSGVHATLAAVLMAFAIPARTRLHGKRLVNRIFEVVEELREAGVPPDTGLLTDRQHKILGHLAESVELSTAPLQRLETMLAPLVKFVVLPIFALANAGVVIPKDVGQVLLTPAVLGTVVGLVVGKQLGIIAFSWLAVTWNWAELPEGVSWRQLHGIGVLAGMGFTMSLFIAGLAFTDPGAHDAAKIGILGASLISAGLGLPLVWRANRSNSTQRLGRHNESARISRDREISPSAG